MRGMVWIALAAACAPVDATVTLLGDGLPADCGTAVSYPDADGDGFGDPAGARQGCPEPGHVVRAGDCDDSDPEVNPRAQEACNGLDDDCDPATDEAGTVWIDGASTADWKGALADASGDVVVGLCGGSARWSDVGVSPAVRTLTVQGIHPSARATVFGDPGRSLVRAWGGDLAVRQVNLVDGRVGAGPDSVVTLDEVTLNGAIVIDPTGARRVELFDVTGEADVQVQITVIGEVELAGVRLPDGGALSVGAGESLVASGLTVLGSRGLAEDQLVLAVGGANAGGRLALDRVQTRDVDVQISGAGTWTGSTLVDSDVVLSVPDLLSTSAVRLRGESGAQLVVRAPTRSDGSRVTVSGLSAEGDMVVQLDGGRRPLDLEGPAIQGLRGQVTISGEVRLLGGRVVDSDSRGYGGVLHLRPDSYLLTDGLTLTGNRADAEEGAVHLERGATVQLSRTDLGRGPSSNLPIDVSGPDLWFDGEGVTTVICTGEGLCE